MKLTEIKTLSRESLLVKIVYVVKKSTLALQLKSSNKKNSLIPIYNEVLKIGSDVKIAEVGDSIELRNDPIYIKDVTPVILDDNEFTEDNYISDSKNIRSDDYVRVDRYIVVPERAIVFSKTIDHTEVDNKLKTYL